MKNKIMVLSTIFIVLMLILVNFKIVYADNEIKEEISTINDVFDTWKDLSDEQLNEIVANSEDTDLAIFLTTLSDEELDFLLEKDTMLLNEITFYEEGETVENEDVYSEQKVESRQIYWEYLMRLAYKPQANAIYATSKTGYYYLNISGDGTTSKYKIQITITNTNLSNQQTAKYSYVEVTSTSNKKEFKLLWASGSTQLATKSGDRSYYEIVALKFSYKKTAHYRSTSSYENKVEGYRMNFSKYSYENDLPTTLNNTGHNEKDTTEVLYMQTNIMNCGMMDYSDGKKYHTTANLDLYLYYGGLKVNPNRRNLEQHHRDIIFYCKMYLDKKYCKSHENRLYIYRLDSVKWQ